MTYGLSNEGTKKAFGVRQRFTGPALATRIGLDLGPSDKPMTIQKTKKLANGPTVSAPLVTPVF